MTESNQSWNFEELSPEARRTAERAAEAAGMPLDTWLNQLIKYVSAMELNGEAPADDNGLDKTIEAMAAAQSEARGSLASAETSPSEDHRPEAEEAEPDDLLPGDEASIGDGISHEGDAVQDADWPPESGPPFGDWDGEAARDDTPPPTALPPDMLSPSRFEDEPPLERDIESAIGGWRRTGSLLPIVVRPDRRDRAASKESRYEIITGAERWHAAKRLKMKQVPVAVTVVSDDDLLRANLIERLRRRNLSPVEEARTYRRLLTKTGRNIVSLAADIGCAPSLITDALKLLELPDAVQTMLEDGELTVLHARALLPAEDPEAVAREVVARQLDIYQTEQLVRNPAAPPAEPEPAEPEPAEFDESEVGESEEDESLSQVEEPDEDNAAPDVPDMMVSPEASEASDDTDEIRMVEKNLSNLLGIQVSIEGGGDAGVLSLHFGDKRGLRDLVSRLNREPPGS